MTNLTSRLKQLFTTTGGLLPVVTAWEALLVALLGTLSATGPLAGFDVPARLGLGETGKVGRIIMLYHSLAVPFVAALVYLILDKVPFAEKYPRTIRPAITAGYMLTSVGGLGFAYLGWGWIAHSIFLVGLSLVFYAGAVLCVGLWPWQGGFTVERLAFWLMALYTLISVSIGGVTGSYFGNGFQAFLAEDVVRDSHNLGQLAIIAHLHIMLTLIDVALLLIAARTFDLRGWAHKWTMWLTVVGATIISFATWSVMFAEKIAHKIINVGATFLLPAAFIVAFYGFAQLARQGLDGERGTFGQRLKALLRDPVRLGILFELLFVNVVVTGPGVYVAFNLETFRQPELLEIERTVLVGHWHVLATLSAAMALFLVMDRLEARGWLRQVAGWGVLTGSTLALGFVQFYMFRQPGQQVGWTIPFMDVGTTIFLAGLAVFLVERWVNWMQKR